MLRNTSSMSELADQVCRGISRDDMELLGVLIWRRRRPRPVVVQWSLTAKTLLHIFSVRRVLFDTGFGFRVHIDLVPRAFGPKP